MSTPDSPSSDPSPRLALDQVLAVLAERMLHILGAERGTIFIYDPFSNTLWSRVAAGAAVELIRIPSTTGLVGESFTADKIINIPDAYADPRFNRDVDLRTGFVTRTVLCVPMHRPDGTKSGVIQVLNKTGGTFSQHDEDLGAVFCDQATITIQNAIAQDALESSRSRERELTDEVIANHAELKQAFDKLNEQKKTLEAALRRQRQILGIALAALLAAAMFAVLLLRAKH